MVVFAMFVYVMTGCKIKQIASKTKQNKTTEELIDLVNREKEEKIKSVWIKKVKGIYSLENKDLHFNSNIRIIKDSIIIISIATDFGIEAMRMYFEKNTLTIINRFNKTWYSESIWEKKEKYGLVYELELLEKVLLMGIGDEILLEMKGKTETNIDSLNYCYVRNGSIGMHKEYFCFDKNTGYLRLRTIEIPVENIKFGIRYLGYEKNDDWILPSEISARLEYKGKEHRVSLYYERCEVNEKFPAKIRVNHSYKRVHSLLDL